MITFCNVLPKSGTNMIALHRNIDMRLHIPLYAKGRADYQATHLYIDAINKRKMDFTGHIPYSDKVYQALIDRGIRIVFVYRDLYDVTASLAEYIKIMGKESEFNVLMKGGYYLKDSPDIIRDAIELTAKWWRDFRPWLDHCDADYTFDELRAAAFLLGKEDRSVTFNRGQSGGWAKLFEDRHLKLAEELL